MFLYFWDTFIYAIKAKYEINKIYSIKVKKKLLVIATLQFLLYAELLCFMTYFFFRDAVICVIKAKYEVKEIYVIKATYKMHSYLFHKGKIRH